MARSKAICTFFSPECGADEPFVLQNGQSPTDLDICDVTQNPLLQRQQGNASHDSMIQFSAPSTPVIKRRPGMPRRVSSTVFPSDPNPAIMDEIDQLLGISPAVRDTKEFMSAKRAFEALRTRLAKYQRVLWLDDQSDLNTTPFFCDFVVPPSLPARFRKKARVNPSHTIKEALAQLFRDHQSTLVDMLTRDGLSTDPDDYILKETGYAEYLIGNYAIGSYECVARARRDNLNPCLTLIPREEASGLFSNAIIGDSDKNKALAIEREVSRLFTIMPNRPSNSIVSRSVEDAIRLRVPSIAPLIISPAAQPELHAVLAPIVELISSRVLVTAAEQCGRYQVGMAHVSVQLVFGSKALCPVATSSSVPVFVPLPAPARPDPYGKEGSCIELAPVGWPEFFGPSLPISHIPADARLVFTVWVQPLADIPSKPAPVAATGPLPFARRRLMRPLPLGNCTVTVATVEGVLQEGSVHVPLWLGEAGSPMATTLANRTSPAPQVATLLFPARQSPVFVHAAPDLSKSDPLKRKTHERSPDPLPEADRRRIREILSRTALHDNSSDDNALLWRSRYYLARHEHGALSAFLRSVNWGNRYAVAEARKMTKTWKLDPLRALELLDVEHSDREVRKFALERLSELDDRWLVHFVLQMTQALKFEPYHDSALARFLLCRSLRNTLSIGHSFFWHVKAELHAPATEERFGVILEEYLRGIPGVAAVRDDVVHQAKLVKELHRIALDVASLPAHSQRSEDPDFRKLVLQNELRALNQMLPERSRLPLSYRLEVRDLIVERSRVMDSKKAPLMLWFQNAELGADPVGVLFKAGDDLRQDQLTLQILRLMDRLWQDRGLNLQLSPYHAISTGWMQGLLELVKSSETCAKITAAAGGARAAFSKTPIADWLKRQNPTKQLYAKAVQNFTHSCAGYCVATYVLGIGDRHNDNIMVTVDGKLFHIDFGHFLGNFKSKFGFRRERAPFVFTPDFGYVIYGDEGMSSSNYKKFEELCCAAYQTLRDNKDLFIHIFLLMLSTGIPELQVKSDIEYMRERLLLDLSDEDAQADLRRQIVKCAKTRSAQVNNAVHILKHR
ncbi:Phosphatidylinositol 3- and 4-kinase [Carpediemonas membranifera]|uniref:Phosphatidylinositol 3- and 4-kinase n=1 Tax=Carpediemonas membranifera TaxID=201153 RepID=A0A8J6ARN9_9EUKA|nr:Phosphatidylinositol 3- and 4-kinase [Carpediemonas membranifera]|eukprot:KAG9392596.1 Phosphatidylinositol 3- and 4-kinase [Carpediemonas membranifera]